VKTEAVFESTKSGIICPRVSSHVGGVAFQEAVGI